MMLNINKTVFAVITAATLLFGTPSAYAVLLSYTITGDVSSGDGSNAFGLVTGDTVTATGIFEDSVLTGGSGTVSFAASTGNTMSISVGTATFTESHDIGFGVGTGASLSFTALALDNFDYVANLGTNGAPSTFNSLFLTFDDLFASNLVGQWRTSVATTVVPVPAAVWLFGSGLLGLVGIARRKKAA